MFRRSGSTAVFCVAGSSPDPMAPDFCDKLAMHRFRGIERAADEDESLGWVSPADPTGERFTLEEIDLEGKIWLQIRLDRKRLPAIWFKIHRGEAERSRGRRLSAAERKELKQELMQRLLPGQLPSVQLVDVLYAPKQRKVFVFSTATRIRDAVVNLFHRTFGCSLEPASPGTWARALELDRSELEYLQRVAPVRWPRPDAEDLPTPRRASRADAPAPRVTIEDDRLEDDGLEDDGNDEPYEFDEPLDGDGADASEATADETSDEEVGA
jgi:hypothetical protein